MQLQASWPIPHVVTSVETPPPECLTHLSGSFKIPHHRCALLGRLAGGGQNQNQPLPLSAWGTKKVLMNGKL